MVLERLSARGFRNLELLSLPFPEGLTVVYGKNAQGKTNLLEAAFAVITGHSHRASRDGEMVSFGADEAAVEALFRRPTGELSLSLKLSRDRRKERRRNGKAFRPGDDVLGDPRVILFSPEDLLLVQGSPSLRRRLVDLDLGQVGRGHIRLVRQYHRALTQRNGALRAGRADLLPAFDAVWVPLALRLTAARRSLMRAFGPFAERAHAGIAPEDGPLGLAYLPSLPEEGDGEVHQLLASLRPEELQRKTTVRGPHRDDIRLSIGDNDLRTYGSQGQQRTAAVAMKVAAVGFVQDREGVPPLLLLDDVLSELDQSRRESLAAVVRSGQAILTTADDGTLPSGLLPSEILYVEKGRVIPAGPHRESGPGTPR